MKNTIIRDIADFFCPLRCINCGRVGEIFCLRCRKNMSFGLKHCLLCGAALEAWSCLCCTLPFEKQYCLGERKGVLKELVNVYKYQSVRVVADVFTELILRTFDFGNDTVFVPLPTISKHVRERGFGHIEYLLWRLSGDDGRRLACAKVLKRVNSTVQVGSSSEKRKTQAAKAYELAKNFDPNKHYILVDDVWTTGSSMLAAAQKMRSQGAQKVDILVIAKTV